MKSDRDDLLGDAIETRENRKNLMKTGCLKKKKKKQFSYRCVDIWKGLENEISKEKYSLI